MKKLELEEEIEILKKKENTARKIIEEVKR